MDAYQLKSCDSIESFTIHIHKFIPTAKTYQMHNKQSHTTHIRTSHTREENPIDSNLQSTSYINEQQQQIAIAIESIYVYNLMAMYDSIKNLRQYTNRIEAIITHPHV